MNFSRIRTGFARFVTAIGLVVAAAAVRAVVIPGLSETPYVVFYPAVIIAALYGGLWPGILAAVLSAVASSIWFGPNSTVQFAVPGTAAGMLVFIAGSFIIVSICAQLLRAQQHIAAEAARLRQSEERQKRAQEIAHLGSWELDLRNNQLIWSDEVYRIFGLQPQEFNATYEAFLEAVHPDDRAAVGAAYSGSLRDGRDSYEIEHRVVRRSNSEVRIVHEKCEHIRDGSGRVILSIGMVHDITDRKQAEISLKRSYDLTKTILDSMHDAISLIDVRDFRIAGVNAAFLSEYGYSGEAEVAGKHCYALTHHRSDVCSPPDDLCPLVETVKTGKHFAVDHVHFDTRGEKRYVEVSTSPIKDENGNVVQVVHIARDITGRKLAEEERERLIAELKRSNRELEQFAYVASHDLQEPLRMVSSYTTLLQRRYKEQLDEKAHEYINFAVDGAERMQKLIEGLLAYSRISRRGAQFRPVDLNRIFSLAVSNLSAAIREARAEVTRDDLPSFAGDETQLVQLFQNLIGNALRYRKPDVPPRVHVSAKREGKQYVFSVEDNGIGIEPEYYDKIFLIFQRLHSRSDYPGTGIGLALCKRIVERHRGRIWVKSVPGEGSTFFISFPAQKGIDHPEMRNP